MLRFCLLVHAAGKVNVGFARRFLFLCGYYIMNLRFIIDIRRPLSLTLIISYLGVLLNRGCPLQPMQLAPALHVRKTLLPQRLIKHNGNGIG